MPAKHGKLKKRENKAPSQKRVNLKKTRVKKKNKRKKAAPATVSTKRESDPRVLQNLNNLHSAPFPVVCIGASAGGLEALQSFFENVDENFGMAIIVVTHLEPTKKSILPQLLQKYSPLNVREISNNIQIERNNVYVIPPNKLLELSDGKLILSEKNKSHTVFHPIDYVFRSCAEQIGGWAIGIVLSGSGTDGAIGIKEIKAEGGIILAQSEETAKFSSMPHSAINTGLVDYILPPEKMPSQLIDYRKRLYEQGADQPAGATDSLLFNKIFTILRHRTKHDFSLYKKNTLYRRIARRMYVHGLDKMSDYVILLQENNAEIQQLFQEFLIGVTRFFRDPEVFNSLKQNHIAKILENQSEDTVLRAWVPGCSTGEDAYSLAILLREAVETFNKHIRIQIFATDIDEQSINTARAALYPQTIRVDVSKERLSRHFVKEGNNFRVKKSIREMIVFAVQSITRDPPFTKLKLLWCRNLLIYFEPALQKKILPLFHYSLIPGGLLILGSSETIGQYSDLFKVEDKTWKIFSRRSLPDVPGASVIEFPTGNSGMVDLKNTHQDSVQKNKSPTNVQKIIETILEQSRLPPCVVVNKYFEIIYVHGHTGRFLEPAIGAPSHNILEMARPGIRVKLTAALQKVIEGDSLVHQSCPFKGDSRQIIPLQLTVKSLGNISNLNDMIMISFDTQVQNSNLPTSNSRRHKKNKEVEQLEQELSDTRENLQSTIEEMEASNEELKSTNEELQSTNEELQSTNEELETSKEELQSLNEESATINAELQSKIDDLSNANDDIKNLLDRTQIATIFLDINLDIRRFTSAVTNIVPLDNKDIGRSIKHFATTLINMELAQYAEKVLNDLIMLEVESQSKTGEIYRIRFRPYRTNKNVIDGVIIVFDEVTDELKFSQKLFDDVTRSAITIVDAIHDPCILLDNKLNIVHLNKKFSRRFKLSEPAMIGSNVFTLLNGIWEIEPLRKLLKEETASASNVQIENLVISTKDNDADKYFMNICTILPQHNTVKLLLLTMQKNSGQ